MNAPIDLALLKHIHIFAGLKDADLKHFQNLLVKVHYQPQEVIFEQDTPPSHIYIIQSGQVKIIRYSSEGPLELILFTSGDCFGETSVIGVQQHSATAIAWEDSDLFILSRKVLLDLYKTHPRLFGQLILNIAREACRRLHKTDEILFHYTVP